MKNLKHNASRQATLMNLHEPLTFSSDQFMVGGYMNLAFRKETLAGDPNLDLQHETELKPQGR